MNFKNKNQELVFRAMRPDIKPANKACILWWGMPIWQNILNCHGVKINSDKLRTALNFLVNDNLALFEYFYYHGNPVPYVYISERVQDRIS